MMMTRRGRPDPHRRAFLLVELVCCVGAAALLVAICFYLFASVVYMQRLAAQHADRTAAVDHLGRRLRADLLSAERVSFENARLMLIGASHTIEYRIEAGRVLRLDSGRESECWQAPRLSFAARLDTGENGALLLIDCIETPPPQATRLAVRRDHLAFPIRKVGDP